MDNAKFEICRYIDKTPIQRVKLLQSAAVRRVGDAYERNIDRIIALSAFPMVFIDYIWISSSCSRNLGDGFHMTPPPRMWSEDEARLPRIVKMLTDSGSFADTESFHSRARLVVESVVVGAWVAFEIATTDLWEAAINARRVDAAKVRGKSGSPDYKTGGQLKQYFQFTSLKTIRHAYWCVLGRWTRHQSLRQPRNSRSLPPEKRGRS